MEQYIDKDILMGQLNIDISNLQNAESEGYINEFGKGKLEGLEGIADFILHFCGKEVDLEKEFCDYLERNFKIGMTGMLLSNNGDPINTIKLFDFARHFFELGLISKGE